MKLLVVTIALICAILPNGVMAQTPIVKDAISVNGLKVGNRYTQQQFLQALGTPTKTVSPSATDEYENAYTYYFGKDRFYLIGGEFYGFDLRTNSFMVNGHIRVGDGISKVYQLDGLRDMRKTQDVQLIEWRPSDDGLYQWASETFYYDSKDVITTITAFIRDL